MGAKKSPYDVAMEARAAKKAEKLALKGDRPGPKSKYEPWMEQAIMAEGERGGTKAMFAGIAGIAMETLYDWINPNSTRFNVSFSNTVSKASRASREYWEKYLRSNLENKEVNTQLFSLLMRNQHGYDSKASVSVDGEGASKLTLNITLNGAQDES